MSWPLCPKPPSLTTYPAPLATPTVACKPTSVAGPAVLLLRTLAFQINECLNLHLNSCDCPACSPPTPRPLAHPRGLGPQYLGLKWQRSLPQEAHVPDGLILQLRPKEGVQLSQDGDEPAARDSTGRVSQDPGAPPRPAPRTMRPVTWPAHHTRRGLCPGLKAPTHGLAQPRSLAWSSWVPAQVWFDLMVRRFLRPELGLDSGTQ